MIPLVLVITGPTASGKTGVAIELARKIDGEIVNADARQVYRGLDIGTAKPDPHQMESIPHHLVGFLDPSEEYSAGQFYHDAKRVIHDIHGRGKCPVVVGGSGLYVKAVCEGLFAGPGKDPGLRVEMDRRLHEEGLEVLVEELEALAPDTARNIDTANPVRVIRALEVCHLTGEEYSVLRNVAHETPPYTCFVSGLKWERRELYERIDRRVDRMLSLGFVDEVRRLLISGIDPGAPAFRTIGYKEILAFLTGDLPGEDLSGTIKQKTRNYAKRQCTWFKRQSDVHWYRVNDATLPQIAGNILRSFHRFQNGFEHHQGESS